MPRATKSPTPEGAGGSRVALGFRAHSGWAALVVVGGPPGAPLALERHRLDLADGSIPGSKQPYHAAEPLEGRAAEAFVGRCLASTRRLARRGLGRIVSALHAKGHNVVGCGIIAGRREPARPLASILASHARIHAAEGRLFRDVLVEAMEDAALPVTQVVERELLEEAVPALGLPRDAILARIAEMGRPLGPPWRQDEKYAALVAWMALG